MRPTTAMSKERMSDMVSYTHLIALNGTGREQLALHLVATTDAQAAEYRDDVLLRLQNAGVPDMVSWQFVPTDEDTLTSVVQLDPYFEQFTFIDDIDEFVSLVSDARSLTALDVAHHLVADLDVDDEQLQHVLYYIYATFLVEYSFVPFSANFIANEHGPFEASVAKINRAYDEYQDGFDFDTKLLGSKMEQTLPAVIERVLTWTRENKAGQSSRSRDTPWSVAYAHGAGTPITDDSILRLHRNEQIA